MEHCFWLNFYLENDYESAIGQMMEAEYGDTLQPESELCRILGLDDPVIAFCVLTRLRPRLGTFGNRVYVKVSGLIRHLRSVDIYRAADFDSKVLGIALEKFGSEVDIGIFLECVSHLLMSADDLELIKRAFGYGRIYR